MPKPAAKTQTKPAAKPKAVVRDLSPDLKRVKKLIQALKLESVEEAMSYGMPCLKAFDKFMTRVREPGVLALRCPLDEKELLMEVNPAIYFETDHYKGWPAVLIRLPKISDTELKHRLQIAWRMLAPKKLLAAKDGNTAPPKKSIGSKKPQKK
jgi:hypothetical protein